MFKCFFGHDLKQIGDMIPVDYGFGKTKPVYPSKCQKCGKKILEQSHGPESWNGAEVKTEPEALEILSKL